MFEEALAAFRTALGADHVLTGDALGRYGADTLPITRQIPAAIRPGSVEEVQQVVRIAAAHEVPLYPISTGQNWGYGTSQPMRDGSVIVDLGRMNRVVELNSELAYVVLEPGVTQRQLFEHLRQQQVRLWLNPTGAGPDCSILANTLERGFGIGPNGDHFMAQCGMEIVLPNGEILRTGFGHYPGARSTWVYKYGVGPYLDGLFTQSGLGIVTKMGVWLVPEPEAFEACYFMCNSESQFGPAVEALRGLLFDGVFRGPVNLLHRDRVLIMLERYPWDALAGRQLDEARAARLAHEKKVAIWNGVGCIAGSREQVRAARQTIKRALRGKVSKLAFLSEQRLAILRTFPKAISVLMNVNVPELLHSLSSSYGMMRGTPSKVALPLAYWRNRRGTPDTDDMNPARDRCGLMWFAPIIPMTPRDVADFRAVIEPIMRKHDFECCITLTAVNERCFDCTLPLMYDLENPAEATRAMACYRELSERCAEAGFYPYRLGLQSMEKEVGRDDIFWTVATSLKRTLDPGNILAPGRYAR
ncbi:MAG: FAD-binding oxidoreductase [Acidobacteria bacterium]|nr:FAD-binding oxidoreductase [Acidobacteriota bacterium]